MSDDGNDEEDDAPPPPPSDTDEAEKHKPSAISSTNDVNSANSAQPCPARLVERQQLGDDCSGTSLLTQVTCPRASNLNPLLDTPVAFVENSPSVCGGFYSMVEGEPVPSLLQEHPQHKCSCDDDVPKGLIIIPGVVPDTCRQRLMDSQTEIEVQAMVARALARALAMHAAREARESDWSQNSPDTFASKPAAAVADAAGPARAVPAAAVPLAAVPGMSHIQAKSTRGGAPETHAAPSGRVQLDGETATALSPGGVVQEATKDRTVPVVAPLGAMIVATEHSHAVLRKPPPWPSSTAGPRRWGPRSPHFGALPLLAQPASAPSMPSRRQDPPTRRVCYVTSRPLVSSTHARGGCSSTVHTIKSEPMLRRGRDGSATAQPLARPNMSALSTPGSAGYLARPRHRQAPAHSPPVVQPCDVWRHVRPKPAYSLLLSQPERWADTKAALRKWRAGQRDAGSAWISDPRNRI